MKNDKKIYSEENRLMRLKEYNILDSDKETVFDNITKLAASIFDVSISLISFVGEHRTWFKSNLGLNITEMPRELSFCTHVVKNDKTLIISDTSRDELFCNNPYVKDSPNAKFYAGAPLKTSDGVIGTLCVIGKKVIQPSLEQINALEILAEQVIYLLNHRKLKWEKQENINDTETVLEVIDKAISISSDELIYFDQKIFNILKIANSYLNMEMSIVSQVQVDEYKVLHSCWYEKQRLSGTVMNIKNTYCKEVIDQNKMLAFFHIPDKFVKSKWFEKFGSRRYIGVPISVSNQFSGCLEFFSKDDYTTKVTNKDKYFVNLIKAIITNEIKSNFKKQNELNQQFNSKMEANANSNQIDFFNQVLEMICILDKDGNILQLNDLWCEKLGHNQIDFLNHNITEFVCKEFENALYKKISLLKDGVEYLNFSFPFYKKNREIIWLSWEAKYEIKTMEIKAIVKDITYLKRIENLKNEFVSTVGHELRTPLTSIRGSLGLLISGALGNIDPRHEDLLKIANDSSSRLIRLIDDMLDIDKIESGHVKFNKKSVDIVEIINKSIYQLRDYGRKHGVYYHVDYPVDNRIIAYVDEDRIRQVIDNLLTNAAKYACNSGEVTIFVEQIHRRVRVSVMDNGPGIPEEFQNKIFTRFGQAQLSNSNTESHGLGLAIVKSIIEEHGGIIDFESIPGKGTTFFFEIESSEAEEITENIISLSSQKNYAGKKVLVIEDNLEIAQLLKFIFTNMGLYVDIAYNSVSGLKKLKENEFDLLTLDLKLPDREGTGEELVQSVKEVRDIPVVIISGADDSLGEKLTLVQDWIEKPFGQKKLESSLNKIFPIRNYPNVLIVDQSKDYFDVINGQLSRDFDFIQIDKISGLLEKFQDTVFDIIILHDEVRSSEIEKNIQPLTKIISSTPIIVFSDNNRKIQKKCKFNFIEVSNKNEIDEIKQIIIDNFNHRNNNIKHAS